MDVIEIIDSDEEDEEMSETIAPNLEKDLANDDIWLKVRGNGDADVIAMDIVSELVCSELPLNRENYDIAEQGNELKERQIAFHEWM